jgi:hypothetical protein
LGNGEGLCSEFFNAHQEFEGWTPRGILFDKKAMSGSVKNRLSGIPVVARPKYFVHAARAILVGFTIAGTWRDAWELLRMPAHKADFGPPVSFC